MNPPLGMYPPLGIVARFISSLPVILPLVLPANVSMAFRFVRCGVGAHPCGLEGMLFPLCACNLVFMCK